MSNRSKYLEAWHAAYNDGKSDAFDAIMASDYVRHYRQSPGFNSLDAEGFKATLLAMRYGFPDIRSRIDDVVGDDSEFTIRWSSEGTHLNKFLGIPPTSKRVVTDGVTVCRFKNDRLQEEWVAWDLQDVANALGFRELRQISPGSTAGNNVDAGSLRKAHGKFVTGVTIVAGSADDGSPFGLAVNAFMSVSLEPPTVVACVGKSSRSHDLFASADAFSVNILASDQDHIARKFGSPGTDKFVGIAWTRGRSGVPLIEGCAASFEAEITECVRASTHTIFIGRVVSVQHSERLPLIYMGSQFFAPSALSPLS
ncbi:MAG: hypothetical protein QOD74_641 [Variibacter sp.]|nr:hypothetical protein [Variibacter sp.]